MNKHATQVPTVLIGIGGIGGQIVRGVDHILKNQDKSFVRLLVLDTNVNDLSKSIAQNLAYVQTSENMTVSDYLRQNKSFVKWFPPNPLINAKNLTQGAGQIRSVSRLGALASEASHRFDTIKDAIEDVNRNVGSNLHSMIRVMIVGSVSGGTGSGMGIQLPFLVRDLVDELANMPRVLVRGLFLMPDIVEEVQDTDEKKRAVYVNAYGFLRELNAFNMAQTYQRGTNKIDIEHYHRANGKFAEDPTLMAGQIPYDFLFLLEKSNVKGQNIGKFDAYVSKAAEIVTSQLFAGDMTANLFSSEDNLIVSAVERNGMNRFCSAGISKAIYPEDENLRYCTLRYAETILNSYWLRFDHVVEANMAQHKRQMAANPSIEPKDPRKEYREVFDQLTDPQQHDVPMELNFLKRELVSQVRRKDEQGNDVVEMVNYGHHLFLAIQAHLNDQFLSEELIQQGNSCKAQMKKMKKDQDSAATYITGKLELLRQYEADAKKRVGELSAGCINAILPNDLSIASIYRDSGKYPYSIYAVLRDKHPIISRYILYYLKDMLTQQVAQCDSELAGFRESEGETIFHKDYYVEKFKDGRADTVIENPAEAINRTNPGLLSFAGINSSDYNKLVRRIVADTAGHVARINAMSELELRQGVYTSVLARIDVLIDIYEDFFSKLESIQASRRKEREILEREQPRIQNSDLYICADPVCKQWLYAEFDNQLKGTDSLTLPENVKEAFFTEVMSEYTHKLESLESETAFTKQPLSMEELFERSILAPMTQKFENKEFAHIKMDIVSALQLEYKVHKSKGMLAVNGQPVTGVNYSFANYFQDVATQLRELSTPYLSYQTVSQEVNELLTRKTNANAVDGRVSCYWGIHDSAVDMLQPRVNGQINRALLTAQFGFSGGTTYYVINGDFYDPKTLICYSSIYDLCIENLDKYRKGQTAEKEYSARLRSVISDTHEVGTGSTDYLKTVHPHLDKRWHAHAYLPMLRVDDEREERKNIAKAFLLAVASHSCEYVTLDHKPCWAFKRPEGRGIRLDGLQLGGKAASKGSFATLFNVLDENALVVSEILAADRALVETVYDSIRVDGITLETLLQHPTICSFIGGTYTEEERGNLLTVFTLLYDKKKTEPINILDVIYSIFKEVNDTFLITALLDNLSEYVYEYCMQMTNGQSGYSEDLLRQVRHAIGKNFSKRETAAREFRMLCEDFLLEE